MRKKLKGVDLNSSHASCRKTRASVPRVDMTWWGIYTKPFWSNPLANWGVYYCKLLPTMWLQIKEEGVKFSNLVNPTVSFPDNICVITLWVMKDCNWLLTLIEGRRCGLFLFLRELMSLEREGGSTIQICGSHSCKTEVTYQRVFSSLSSPPVFLLLMTFFPRFNTFEMGPQKKESGGRGSQGAFKRERKNVTFRIFFFNTRNTANSCVSFACV